ncbi:MAG: sigma factor-like helix-turn-helix DNA-binding protein [bacterium]|nr:sigma factor-like helix-turn-helix DNA-binding protein [bacterium]
MEMEKILYLNILYDYYKELLTDKQRHYFELYYEDNLSLSEIAENENVSRNAVHNQIKIVEKKLQELENKLGLYKKKSIIIKLVENIVSKDILDKINELL